MKWRSPYIKPSIRPGGQARWVRDCVKREQRAREKMRDCALVWKAHRGEFVGRAALNCAVWYRDVARVVHDCI